jgi:hypothetical protein
MPARGIALCLRTRRGRSLCRAGRRELDAGAPCLRQTNGDGLLGRAGAVSALSYVFDLFTDELSGLGGGGFAGLLVGSGSRHCLLSGMIALF